MNRKEQITAEFEKRLEKDSELREKLEKAVNLFRDQWKSETSRPIDKFYEDARTAFFTIAELVATTYTTKENWGEKEKLFISSYRRESTANLRPLHESNVIDELKRNVQIGYAAVVTDKSFADREYHDFCGVIKKYYSRFWEF